MMEQCYFDLTSLRDKDRSLERSLKTTSKLMKGSFITRTQDDIQNKILMHKQLVFLQAKGEYLMGECAKPSEYRIVNMKVMS